MADIVSVETRSRMMSGIRSRNTKPERIVRRHLHRLGFRFRLHVRDLPGRPDIVLKASRSVVFVNGCFWHQHPGCRYAYMPKSRTEFWVAKLTGNVQRDIAVTGALVSQGWSVYTVWECDLGDETLDRLATQLSSRIGATGSLVAQPSPHE